MADHDYAIEIGGTALDSIVSGLKGRFTKYSSAQRRGNDLIIPYQHGVLFVPDKYFTDSDVLLELRIPAPDEATATEALSELALLYAGPGLVAVQQTDPHRGDIEAQTQLVTDPIPTQSRLVYMFGLNVPSGFWQDVSATTITAGSPPSITTSGDRPIQDMILSFAGAGYLEHTDPLGVVSRIEVLSGGPGGAYTVDVGAATITNGGSPADEYLDVTQAWWMKWEPGAALSLAGNVSVGGSYRNKWAAS